MPSDGSVIFLWIIFSHYDVNFLYFRGKKSLVYYSFFRGMRTSVHLRVFARGVALWPCRSSLDGGCMAALATYQATNFLVRSGTGPQNEEVEKITCKYLV